LREGVSALGEVIALIHVNVNDTAVAKRHTAPRSVREFCGEADGAVCGGFENQVRQAIERCMRVGLQRELRGCRCGD
jgi:hypothetical protein